MANSVVYRFNYTNRISIDKSAAILRTIQPPVGSPLVRIDKLALPDNGAEVHGAGVWNTALVILEAWRIRTNSFFRKEVGTVADLEKRSPPLFEDRLTEFDDQHQISFRIKVVSSDRVLLAQGDRLKSIDEETRAKSELIKVFPADIGEEVWRIDWNDLDQGPVVLVNKKLPNPRDFLTGNPTVTALVLPSIVRDVLYEIARNYSDYAHQDWSREWLDFVIRFFDRPLTEDMELPAIHEWVRDAVGAFSEAHKLCSGLVANFAEDQKDEE